MSRKIISSVQNPLIKEIVRLTEKASARKESNTMVCEGVRESLLALKAGLRVKKILLCLDIYKPDPLYPIALERYDDQIIEISPEVYSKIAYRGGVEGVVCLLENFVPSLSGLRLSDNPLILVLESVEKPGNLGAILRTADAAGVDAVVVCDPRTDIFNPNVIRSSLGCVFSVQTAVCTASEWFTWAEENKINCLLASVQSEKYYYDYDLTRPTALILGTEATGLTDIWYSKSYQAIKIPMAGSIDSLNVSVSAAIIAFEAVRQRRLKG